jgi:hypothetical protein
MAKIEYPTEPVDPSWHIPLSDDELRTLGELCAIQGQIEWLMQLTVMVLRKVSLQKARKLLGSPNISANARIWLTAVEKGRSRRDIRQLAKAVVDEIDVIRQGRNDFVHAVFAYGEGEDAFSMTRKPDQNDLQRKPVVAVHNLKTKPLANLKAIRDKAATISHFIDFVYECTSGLPGTESAAAGSPSARSLPGGSAAGP